MKETVAHELLQPLLRHRGANPWISRKDWALSRHGCREWMMAATRKERAVEKAR
jgi:hypothetical protein